MIDAVMEKAAALSTQSRALKLLQRDHAKPNPHTTDLLGDADEDTEEGGMNEAEIEAIMTAAAEKSVLERDARREGGKGAGVAQEEPVTVTEVMGEQEGGTGGGDAGLEGRAVGIDLVSVWGVKRKGFAVMGGGGVFGCGRR